MAEVMEVMPMRLSSLIILALLPSAGCTNLALKRNTLHHIESSKDIRYQQVLDNLAQFNAYPHSLPAYSITFSGTTKIQDQASIGSATNIGREAVGKAGATVTHIQSETMDIPAQRGVSENWTLDPVTGPEKLKAIRLACWWVLFGKESAIETDDVHLGAPPKGEAPDKMDSAKRGYYFNVASLLEKLPGDWLHRGEFKDVPGDAVYKAQSHGKWVWVMADGVDGLSQFTLIIQALARQVTDQAYYPPPVTRAITFTTTADGKSVTAKFFVDGAGNPVADASSYAYPVKKRLETTVLDPNLKSQIAASATGH